MTPIHNQVHQWLVSLLSWLLLVTGQPLTAPPAVAVAAPVEQGALAERVTVREETVTLATFPYERYQTPVRDPYYDWPYQRFDYERFRTEAPDPTPRRYRAVIMENQYLRLTILPELGGRIWRVIHKPSGNDLFYHNSVVMPSPWGPTNMRGWFAVGGLEWNLPVVEHGYDWGTPWTVTTTHNDGRSATVTLSTPQDGRTLAADIAVSLRADEAAFSIAPSITNVSDAPVRFAFWHSAALAPGQANRPSANLHFVVPGDQVTVHSTGDATLPGPDQPLAWPIFAGRDLSRLGTWTDYLGVFERPAAHGPFVAVYDRDQEAGAVRSYPANVARGSKIFGLGYRQALDPAYYTVDESAYVELHGGLAPTFGDEITLPEQGTVEWEESWFPVHGIGDIRVANATGALNWQASPTGLQVSYYPTRAFEGKVVVRSGQQELVRLPFRATPAAPFAQLVYTGTLPSAPLSVQIIDAMGATVIAGN